MLEKLNVNSMKFRISSACLVIVILLLCVLLASNIYASRNVNAQLFSTYYTILSTYTHGLDNNLNDLELFLASRYADTSDLQLLKRHDLDWSMAATRLHRDLSEAVMSYSLADGFFVYEPGHELWIDATVPNYGYEHRLEIRRYISESDRRGMEEKQLKYWTIQNIAGEYVLFRLLNIQGCYMGTWIDVDSLTDGLNIREFSHDGYILFTNPDGLVYNTLPPVDRIPVEPVSSASYGHMDNGYMRVALRSQKLNGYFVLSLKDGSIMQGMNVFYLLVLLLSLGAVIAVIGVFAAIYRYVLKPFHSLMQAMQEFQKGNWDIRLPTENELDEFADINDTFNHMVEQVESLKIDNYEQKLERKEIENQMLKEQMAPHTFINCLNTIHGLAGTGKIDRIQQMAEKLGNHLRYILSVSQTVPFSLDLDHARNYVEICNIRYQNGVNLHEEIEPAVFRANVPPLIIHTFVENSVKYAMSTDRTTDIFLRAWREGSRLSIEMYDNGPGYTEEMLRKLQKAQNGNRDSSGKRIGLTNLCRRTVLLYGEEQTRICFSNRPQGGAQIHITIPYCVLGVNHYDADLVSR